MSPQIYVQEHDLEAIDNAAEALFGTTEITRRLVVKRLIEDHDDVNGYEDGDSE